MKKFTLSEATIDSITDFSLKYGGYSNSNLPKKEVEKEEIVAKIDPNMSFLYKRRRKLIENILNKDRESEKKRMAKKRKARQASINEWLLSSEDEFSDIPF